MVTFGLRGAKLLCCRGFFSHSVIFISVMEESEEEECFLEKHYKSFTTLNCNFPKLLAGGENHMRKAAFYCNCSRLKKKKKKP